MTEAAVHELINTIDTVRQIVNHLHPNSVIPFSLFDIIDTQAGYGVSTGPGLSLIWADVTDAEPTTWSLQFTSAVAFDVPSIAQAASWVNARNRQSAVGKYYYVASRDGQMAAVMWEVLVWSRLLGDVFNPANQPILQWLINIVNICVDSSTNEASQFINDFGGRLLTADDQDMTALFVASSAG